MTIMNLPPVRDRRPLAVQVYDRLFDALSNASGSPAALPTEEELTRQLGVSRTTVRQALALLEEDGVIERGPGRRRHVAGTAPARAGTVVALETMVRAPERILVRRIARTLSPATEWNSRLLGIDRGDEIVTWESELLIDDTVVASALEFIQASDEPVTQTEDATLFAQLGAQYQAKAELASLRIAPYITDTRRIGRRRQGASLITLTFTTRAPGKPTYLAKHVVDLDAVPLELLTGSAAADAEGGDEETG
ncbi:hypothetical protein CQ045_13290 [Microbacterium sp. MYb66]|jgi:DNA-binding GntR family transcriptional regulator|nr:hypothetical protein CQ045_13290 [Microbacterium sp. MYb66]